MDRAHDRYHPSWPAHARASFEGVIEAHGGWEAWDRLECVRFKLRLLRGFLVRIKGLGRTFHAPEAISVEPHRRRATFHFPDHDDVFDDGRLTLSLCTSPSPARGSPPPTVIDDGVRLFRGATFERWSPGHAAYFFGYAWVNYLSYPFLLPRLELAGGASVIEPSTSGSPRGSAPTAASSASFLTTEGCCAATTTGRRSRGLWCSGPTRPIAMSRDTVSRSLAGAGPGRAWAPSPRRSWASLVSSNPDPPRCYNGP